MLSVRPSSHAVGVNTTPTVTESDVSGSRFGLPPNSPLYWPAGLAGTEPYCSGVTPVFAQASADSSGLAPAQGSIPDQRPRFCGANCSRMLGARTARENPPRNLKPSTGTQAPPML